MKNGILVVSFGTTYKEARKLSLEQIENTISSAYRNFQYTKHIQVKLYKNAYMKMKVFCTLC